MAQRVPRPFGPIAAQDEVDEVEADEGVVETRRHIGVHCGEGGVRAMPHTVRESPENVLFEMRSRMRRRDGLESFRRQFVAADAQHIGGDTAPHASPTGIRTSVASLFPACGLAA